MNARPVPPTRPREVDPAEPIAVGFDGSLNDDSTVIRGCCMSDGYRFTLWERPAALDAGRLLACEAIVRCSTSPNADRPADWLRDLRLTQPLPKETDHA